MGTDVIFWVFLAMAIIGYLWLIWDEENRGYDPNRHAQTNRRTKARAYNLEDVDHRGDPIRWSRRKDDKVDPDYIYVDRWGNGGGFVGKP
jgi:hypothetical protein